MPRVQEFEAVERALTADLAEAARSGVHACLSPVFKTPGEVGHGSPLFLDMTLEARILFDKRLRKERELAFYGDIDLIPTREYSRADSERAIADAGIVLATARSFIEAIG
jgi:hypothetical protein